MLLGFLVSGVKILQHLSLRGTQFHPCLFAFELRLLQFTFSRAPVPDGDRRRGILRVGFRCPAVPRGEVEDVSIAQTRDRALLRKYAHDKRCGVRGDCR